MIVARISELETKLENLADYVMRIDRKLKAVESRLADLEDRVTENGG